MPQFAVGWASVLALVWGIGLSSPRPALFADSTFGSDIVPDQAITATHINDERRYYYPYTGLLTARPGVEMPDHRWFRLGKLARQSDVRVALTDAAGFAGFAAGPTIHYVDRWGLGDPLLARLPADAQWEIGHFARAMPDGYLETIESGRNLIRDAGVRAYYDRLRILTEGPIWSRERLRTILRMNLGRYDKYVEAYGIVSVDLSAVSLTRPDGTDWNFPGNVVTKRSIEIRLPETRSAETLELSVSRDDNYRVILLNHGEKTAERHIGAVPFRTMREVGLDGEVEIKEMLSDGSLLTHVVDVPTGVLFDSILVQPSDGDGRYGLGHLRIEP